MHAPRLDDPRSADSPAQTDDPVASGIAGDAAWYWVSSGTSRPDPALSVVYRTVSGGWRTPAGPDGFYVEWDRSGAQTIRFCCPHCASPSGSDPVLHGDEHGLCPDPDGDAATAAGYPHASTHDGLPGRSVCPPGWNHLQGSGVVTDSNTNANVSTMPKASRSRRGVHRDVWGDSANAGCGEVA